MKKGIADDYMSDFLEACHKNDLKITPQRIEIYKELVRYNDHPSVKTIYLRVKKKFPNISFDTVNRTLQTFVDIGVARLVEGLEDIRKYDGKKERHHHFHCIKCHKIIDVFDESLDGIEIPKIISDNFTIIESKIVFEGLCNKCKKEKIKV